MIAENIMNRDFTANQPNEKWVGDITEFNVNGSKLYLSAMMDLYNNEIVAYEKNRHPELKMTLSVLRAALSDIDADGLLIHNDRGGQYTARQYQKEIENAGAIASMSRPGNCRDNACIESFFSHLKCEIWHNQKIRDVSELEKKIDEYIWFYNNERYQSKLKGMTPVEYRNHAGLYS